jgi:hypothetical protein
VCYAAFAAHQKFCLLSFKDAKRKSYRGRIIGFVCDFFACNFNGVACREQL